MQESKTESRNRDTPPDLEELLKMPLGAERQCGADMYALRVPGGWVYRGYREDTMCASCFVPEPVEEEIVSVKEVGLATKYNMVLALLNHVYNHMNIPWDVHKFIEQDLKKTGIDLSERIGL